MKDNLAIWSRILDDALWAFRAAYKTSTRTTPYKLVYGKNYHLPFEIEHRTYWALKNYNPNLIAAGEKRMFQLHELDESRHQAYENSRLYKRDCLDMKPLKCSEVYDGKAKRWTKIPNMWPGGGENPLAPPLLAVPHRDKDSKAPPLLAILRNDLYVVDATTYTSFLAIGALGDGVFVSSWVKSTNNCFGGMMLIFDLLEALEMEALVDVMDVDNG
ncbi:reverse transcriptase domain-containing protein [Tanacetum coccineum]|uniref:Reverse transcriptase domain-containing protein n=1 Tax=Tanacetum coccineum TaxID=301880 RepID=A0ABQ4Y835_9ASTR